MILTVESYQITEIVQGLGLISIHTFLAETVDHRGRKPIAVLNLTTSNELIILVPEQSERFRLSWRRSVLLPARRAGPYWRLARDCC